MSRLAVIVTAMMFGLSYSLSASLIALDLSGRGLSESFIGANAALHAAGVLAMAMLLPRLVARIGARALILLALLMAAATLAAFPLLPWLWLWFPLRFVLGAASEVLFVLSETWTNSLSTEETRARWMAGYTAALSLGFALGPSILSLSGTGGALPYLIGSAIALVAMLFVVSPQLIAPGFDEEAAGSPLRFMRLAPLAMGATVLNAAIETAGLSFLALYAMRLGWPQEEAARLVTCMMVGAILLQLPIGWLGDKVNRLKLAAALAALAAAGALLWPLVLGNEWLTYGLLFVWGGVFVGIYTIMLAIVGSRFAGAELVGIYAAMGLVWGGGALLGPVLAGMAMDGFRHGLAGFAAAICALFCLFAVWLSRRPQAA
jgi:MFS family permease